MRKFLALLLLIASFSSAQHIEDDGLTIGKLGLNKVGTVLQGTTAIDSLAWIVGEGGTLSLRIADTYPVLYSLKQLYTTASDTCGLFRKSSNNDSLWVGFANGILDTATLRAWKGTDTVYVRKWFDQSGNGNHAVQLTSANQPIYNDSLAIKFDAGNDYLDAGNNSNLNIGTGDFTAIVTLNPNTTGSHKCLFKKQSSYTECYTFALGDYSATNYRLVAYLENNEFKSTAYIVPINSISNITFVVRAGATTYVDYYVDGVFKETKSRLDVGDITSSEPMQIGNNADGGWVYFGGSMENFIFVKYQLTATQISLINTYLQ